MRLTASCFVVRGFPLQLGREAENVRAPSVKTDDVDQRCSLLGDIQGSMKKFDSHSLMDRIRYQDEYKTYLEGCEERLNGMYRDFLVGITLPTNR